MRIKKVENFGIIKKFLESYRESTGSSPTVKEIEEGTGIPHTTVFRYLNEMKEKGDISFDGHRNIVTREAKAAAQSSIMVPILGNIACGIPNYAEENIEEYVQLPVSLFGRGEFFILRAYGDSMIEAGICEDDLVIVKHQQTAEAGQIVVAMVEGETTLKRYFPEPEKKRIRLHPENSSMEDIYVSECDIQGVALHVLKSLE